MVIINPQLIILDHAQESTFGQRLARATTVISSNLAHMDPPMSRDDCYAATHPSEHNSVFVIGRSGYRRKMRQTQWEKRREKDAEKIGKGGRTRKDRETEDRYLRGRDHEFPFSSPVPKTHGYGCPHAQKSYASACAAVRPPSVFPALSCDPCADIILGCVWMCHTPRKPIWLWLLVEYL